MYFIESNLWGTPETETSSYLAEQKVLYNVLQVYYKVQIEAECKVTVVQDHVRACWNMFDLVVHNHDISDSSHQTQKIGALLVNSSCSCFAAILLFYWKTKP